MKKIAFASFFIFGFSFMAFADNTPSLAQVLEWKYGFCAGTKQIDSKDTSENPKMAISYWKCPDKQPSEQEISDLTEQFIILKKQDEDSEQEKLDEIFKKLDLNEADVKALADAVRKIK